jgi:hypothetical protein
MNASGEYDTTAEINKKFAELYGHHYTGEKVYTDASLTTEVKADDSDKKRSIAIAEVLQDFQEGATNLAKNISKEDLFNAIFSEDGKFITESMLKDYRRVPTTGEDLEDFDIAALMNDLKIGEEYTKAVEENITKALESFDIRKTEIKKKLK